MKKMLLAVAVAFAFVAGVYAAEEKKAEAKADAKAEAVVCAKCAELNKNLKEGEAKKMCPDCQKKADEAKKAEKKAE